VILFSLFDWRRLLKAKASWLILIALIIIGGIVYLKYRQFKLAREYLPKVYNVTRETGFQAEVVKVSGVNFFPVWRKGKVMLGNSEMIIKSWDENLILAEQPVPDRFGQVELFVLRSDGVASNRVPFIIRDPDTLENF